MKTEKCGFAGCKKSAAWSCRKLWGGGGVLLTCDDHKPDPDRRPEALRKLPFFYDVSPLARKTDAPVDA